MSGDGGMAGGLPTYCVLDATEVEVEAAALSGVADVICFDAHDPKDVPDSVESCDAVRVSNPFSRSTHPSRSSPRGVSDTCTHASPCSAPSIPSALVPPSIPFHTSRYSHTHTHTHAAHTHTTSDHQVGVWHSIFLDEALIRRFKSCRVIVRMGVGYDNVDIAAAARMGIAVCNIPDYGKEGRKKGRKRGYRE